MDVVSTRFGYCILKNMIYVGFLIAKNVGMVRNTIQALYTANLGMRSLQYHSFNHPMSACTILSNESKYSSFRSTCTRDNDAL